MYQIELIIGADTRLAELIVEHPDLIDVLAQLNIKLGFGEHTIRELALRYNINLEAFLAIIYTFCNRPIPGKIICREALGDLLIFLENSHNNFKHYQIPELKKLIGLFAEEIPERYGQMLISFFDGYISEVLEHFRYEDDTVFSYINLILDHHETQGFAIREFEKNHTDIEQKLLDLKNILIKYIPEEVESTYRIPVLRYLIAFEQQLVYHTKLEDQVLAPSVRKVEKKKKKKEEKAEE